MATNSPKKIKCYLNNNNAMNKKKGIRRITSNDVDDNGKDEEKVQNHFIRINK